MKQTEIGLIPDDWEVKTLGDVCSFYNGVAHENYVDDNGEFILVNSKFISSDAKIIKYSKKQLFKVEENTVLMVMSDVPNGKAIAKCFLVPSNFKGTLNQRICMFSDFKTDRDYTYRIINRNPYYLAFDDGIKQTNLRKQDVLNCPIAFPPTLAEQQRIAKALSDVDALISTIELLIQKKKNIKQGTMQNLLTGKKRLPCFAKSTNYKQTELGPIPEDWEVKCIKDFAKVYDGTHQTPHYVDVGIPFYSVENVTANDFIHTKLISEQEHKLLTTKVKIEKGDLLMTRIGSIGDCKYVDWEPEASFYVSLALIKCDTSVDARFISYYSNSIQFKKELELRSLITAIPQKINLGPISEIILILPPKEEQTAIANVLSSMDKEIETLNTKLEKYRNLKTAMMQQLLTGKIRLLASETAEAISDKKQRTPNPFFKRSVLAAEIVDRLHDEPTFGHVKLQKLIFLTEKMCGIDIDSSYHRDAAGPYDNYGLRSIDSQLEKQKWFSVEHTENAYRYTPLENRGGHKQYFERYYADKKETFDLIIKIFQTAKTEQCEIVATLYSAWEDFLNQGITPTDEQIVNEVLTNWNESKKRIPKDRWMKALSWMKEKGFVPQV